MIVADTHAWIWWIAEPEQLSTRAMAALGSDDVIGVSVMTCWEVAMLARRRRIVLDRDPYDWFQESLADNGAKLLPISVEIAAMAGTFDIPGVNDPADRLILATAIHHEAPLVTKDRRMWHVPDLNLIW